MLSMLDILRDGCSGCEFSGFGFRVFGLLGCGSWLFLMMGYIHNG